TKTVQHELLHVIGLWHEHMRYDRDKYVKIHYENILPADQITNKTYDTMIVERKLRSTITVRYDSLGTLDSV
ncbi:hypothetical protein KIN20_029310, partial [Parelaphostrongylus tenuis]